jgi:hypothetical protein
MTRTKGHFAIVLPILLMWLSGRPAPTYASQFAGGTGEPNDPYQIATAEQLMAVSGNLGLFTKSFILTADIDLDPRLPGRKVFSSAVLQWTEPPARGSAAANVNFEGCFDGDGHSICNCVIQSYSHAGFFFSIGSKGTVRNLHLRDVFVRGIGTGVVSRGSFIVDGNSITFIDHYDALPVYHGAIAVANGGFIQKCSATGTITGDMDAMSAGLVGLNVGALTDCSAECRIVAYDAGGLVGFNETPGQVISCTSNGVVFGTGHSGGLVVSNSGSIQQCKAEGYVSGTYVGGIACGNAGTVRESRAAALMAPFSAPASIRTAGGLAFENTGTVLNCYSTPTVVSGTLNDGLVASNSGTVLTSYSTIPCMAKPSPTDGQTRRALADAASGTASVRYVYYPDPNKPQGQSLDPNTYGYGVPLLPEEMMHQASFLGWDFDAVWAIHEGQEYPHLRWEESAGNKGCH